MGGGQPPPYMSLLAASTSLATFFTTFCIAARRGSRREGLSAEFSHTVPRPGSAPPHHPRHNSNQACHRAHEDARQLYLEAGQAVVLVAQRALAAGTPLVACGAAAQGEKRVWSASGVSIQCCG